MKPGDIVFFKKAKLGSAPNYQELGFQGHGFGVLLGHVGTFVKDPSESDVSKIMASVGYISFDDVGDFLSPEHLEICINKFEEKYNDSKDEDKQLSLIPEVKNSTELPITPDETVN